MKVRYSYLPQQFGDCEDLWDDLRAFVPTGDFTLGKPLEEFEKNFANLIGTKYAIGVNSGTDALMISLWSAGIKKGDEVITSPISFIATSNSICHIGATPVFVDVGNDLNINPDLIEEKITDMFFW